MGHHMKAKRLLRKHDMDKSPKPEKPMGLTIFFFSFTGEDRRMLNKQERSVLGGKTRETWELEKLLGAQNEAGGGTGVRWLGTASPTL